MSQGIRSSHTRSRADTQLLPVLRSESMQNFLIFGFTVLSTCRVSPANACAAHPHLASSRFLPCLDAAQSMFLKQQALCGSARGTLSQAPLLYMRSFTKRTIADELHTRMPAVYVGRASSAQAL